MKRPIELILATIILGMAALGQLLFAALMLFVSFVAKHDSSGPYTPNTPGAPFTPAIMAYVLLGFALFVVLLAVWAITTAIGLLRLRNWARISVLIIGGGMAFLGGLSAFGLIITWIIQSRLPPPPHLSHNIQMATFSIMSAFYIFILAIGVWWLVYFTRATTRALFVRPSSRPGGYDFIATDPAFPRSSPRRFGHVPIAIIIMACLFFISVFVCVIMAFIPFPVFLFGFVLSDRSAHLLFIGLAIFSASVGYGLLHLKNWARLAALIQFGLGFINIALMLLPRNQSQIFLYDQQLMQRWYLPASPANTPEMTHVYMINGFATALVINVVFIWLIERHRNAFQQTPPPPIPA
jgi:hypothetical protein